MHSSEVKKSVKTRNGLSREAFAIIGNPANSEKWQLPHYTRAIFKVLTGSLDVKRTIDWERFGAVVAAILPRNGAGKKIEASPGETIESARHLAAHCRNADRPLIDILAALI